MAIAPGSYSFMGGAVLGKGSEGQFVLVRSGSLLTAFTNDEYNACLEAVNDGKAVCVQYKVGPVTFQTQLLNVTGLGDLQFVDTSVQSVTHYRVAGTSPHTVSIVKTGSAQQFVLERDDMSTAFTASEYLQCQTRISEGTALCVQWKSGSARMQAQLATMLADGSLLFSHTTVDLETIFIVAGSDPHNVTAHTNSLRGGDQFVLVRSDMTSMFTNTEYQDCVDAVVAGKAVCVQYGSNQIQLGGIAGGALVFTQSAPDIITKYTVSPLTGLHTISAERIAVGVPIYASLQSAIADEAKLPIGTYFETNGFHTAGDGGGARYYVSSSGTANGKNVIQLAVGKLAVLQVGDWISPEHLGYQQSYSRPDVVPYIEHAISIGCQHIHLQASHSGGYGWRTTLTVNVRGFELIGEGDWGSPNKFSYVYFRPDVGVDTMIVLNMRSVRIEHIDFEVVGDDVNNVDGIVCTSYNHDETRYWYLSDLRFNSFRYAIDLRGGIKWIIDFTNILVNAGTYGIRFYESSSMLVRMNNVYFGSISECDLVLTGNVYQLICENCNFGIQKRAVQFRVPADNYHYQNVNFTNCQFEIDNNDIDNIDSVVFDCFDPDHTIDQNIAVNSCNFTLIRNSWTVYPNIRSVKLGTHTHILFKNCTILGDDTEQAMSMPFEKMWNENYLPSNGSITFVGEQIQFKLPPALVPYLRSNSSNLLVRTDGAEAMTDCDLCIPTFDKSMQVFKVSSYEDTPTTHMPATTFGWLTAYVNENYRVMQMLVAGNGNIYTRLGRYSTDHWNFDAWKTITAS